MSRNLARYISIVGHPVFLPALAILAITQWHFTVSASLNPENKWIFVLAYLLSLTIVPTIGVALMLKKYTTEELSNMTREERISASGVLSGVYFFVAFAFKQMFVDDILKVFVIALGTSALILAILTKYFKISFHSFGWAGILILMFAISRESLVNMGVIIIAVLLIGALVMTARLKLGAHNHREVYLGYLIGLFCNALVYIIYYGI